MAIFCFDFDKTITNQHMHHTLSTALKTNMQNYNMDYNTARTNVIASIPQLVNQQNYIKNQQQLKETFDRILADGHQIAITSFTHFPEVVVPTLRQLGLTTAQINQIKIVGGFPNNAQPNPNDFNDPYRYEPTFDSSGNPGHPHRKEQHIGVVMRHFRENDVSQVVLVDDDPQNIAKATNMRHKAVQVPKDPISSQTPVNQKADYINQIQQLSTEFRLRRAAAEEATRKAQFASQPPQRRRSSSQGARRGPVPQGAPQQNKQQAHFSQRAHQVRSSTDVLQQKFLGLNSNQRQNFMHRLSLADNETFHSVMARQNVSDLVQMQIHLNQAPPALSHIRQEVSTRLYTWQNNTQNTLSRPFSVEQDKPSYVQTLNFARYNFPSIFQATLENMQTLDVMQLRDFVQNMRDPNYELLRDIKSRFDQINRQNMEQSLQREVPTPTDGHVRLNMPADQEFGHYQQYSSTSSNNNAMPQTKLFNSLDDLLLADEKSLATKYAEQFPQKFLKRVFSSSKSDRQNAFSSISQAITNINQNPSLSFDDKCTQLHQAVDMAALYLKDGSKIKRFLDDVKSDLEEFNPKLKQAIEAPTSRKRFDV